MCVREREREGKRENCMHTGVWTCAGFPVHSVCVNSSTAAVSMLNFVYSSVCRCLNVCVCVCVCVCVRVCVCVCVCDYAVVCGE